MATTHFSGPVDSKGGFKVNGTEVITSEGAVTADIQATAGSIGLTELASGITPSHVIKFVALGSSITTTALVGLEVGDLVLQFVAADGTVVAAPVATEDTLPNDPADADYIVVLRAAA